jgi:hypothetical protein
MGSKPFPSTGKEPALNAAEGLDRGDSLSHMPPFAFSVGERKIMIHFVRLLDSVIPAWSAGIQADMDVSGRIVRIWMPAIHAGMTLPRSDS